MEKQEKGVFLTGIICSLIMIAVGTTLPLLLLDGCVDLLDEELSEPNDTNDILVFYKEPKFEDRDPNVALMSFSLEEDDINKVVEIGIDPNGYLCIRTENCDTKEAARVVWKCCHMMKDSFEGMSESMQDWMDAN